MHTTRLWPLIPVALGALVLAGCGNKFHQQFQDAPRLPVVNSAPAEVIEMPDGFRNLATKCDHGNRLYVAFHGDDNSAAIYAVPHDPTCAGK